MITTTKYVNEVLEIQRKNSFDTINTAVADIMEQRMKNYDQIVQPLIDEFNEERYITAIEGRIRRDN